MLRGYPQMLFYLAADGLWKTLNFCSESAIPATWRSAAREQFAADSDK
jgi:hypothetical protein